MIIGENRLKKMFVKGGDDMPFILDKHLLSVVTIGNQIVWEKGG